jgi:hypothetical protein
MKYLLGLKHMRFRKLAGRGPSVLALGVLKLFGKGGVHGVGTVVFTVSA